MLRKSVFAALLALAGCTNRPIVPAAPAPAVEVQILAFNDFHGNLEPPSAVEVTEADGSKRKIQTGGVANLAERETLLQPRKPETARCVIEDPL